MGGSSFQHTENIIVWLPAMWADVPRINLLYPYSRDVDKEVEDCIVEICPGSTLLRFYH